jgi:mono/diheme cytochrome c family protein
MAQNGTRLSDSSFLTGGMVDDWSALALRGKDSRVQQWTTEQVAAYLATGRNAHAVANGEMALVVEHSMQYMTDADLNAMAKFLKTMDGQAADAALKSGHAGLAATVLPRRMKPARPRPNC